MNTIAITQAKERLDNLPPENPDFSNDVKLLAESGLKEAIAPLTRLLVYKASWDHHTCCEEPLHEEVRMTLRKFVADDNSEFRYEAAREAIALHAQESENFYKDILKTWAIELLVGLTYHNCINREWAREQLKKLVGTQVL